MKDKMFWKILLLMKRRPGMSVEDLRDYYENNHIPLCLPYMSGISRYLRRYLNPQPHAESGMNDELPYDVITEMWFDDEAVFKASLSYLTSTVLPDEIIQDELRFFHRPSMRIATVVELETEMN